MFFYIFLRRFWCHTLFQACGEKAAIFELNEKSEVQHSHITRTVIRSDRRFTYEEAQEIIESGKGDYSSEILKLNDLAQKLRERRFSEGSINFDRHEVKFEIDENGRVCLLNSTTSANVP